ncbi:MAG: hypothetical protein ACI87O_002424 [Planctomycetota bacterium]
MAIEEAEQGSLPTRAFCPRASIYANKGPQRGYKDVTQRCWQIRQREASKGYNWAMWNLLLPIALLTFPFQRDLGACEPWLQEPAAKPEYSADAHLQGLARGIEKQVAEIRGMPFKRPVEVHFASKETFVQYFRSMEERMGGAERAERERQMAVLLQLIPSDLDVGALQEELLAGQVGGFYDPAEDTFFVMEGLADDLIRIIMAHELTHALDDQYFDLGAKDLELQASTDSLLAHHAVIEGCAQVVMNQWLILNQRSLDQKALQEFQEQMDMQSLAVAPRLVWKPIMALYVHGHAFLVRKTKLGVLDMFKKVASEDLDRAFQHLPASTEQILHPKKYWVEEALDPPHSIQQDLSELPEGWKTFHSDVLGELFLGLLSVPPDGSLTPMSILTLKHTDSSNAGWGGDRVQILTKADAKVLVLDTLWDTEVDAEEFAGALAKRNFPVDLLPGRAESQVQFQKGSRWVRLVAWIASSREEAKEVASCIPASASRLGKISAPGPPKRRGASK